MYEFAYTSEGCNSCPAAEVWLGQLEDRGFGSDRVIPIALHVDYWDYLGWRDIYADPRHSQRQQQHVKRNRLSTAYTPQLILDGKNLRPSRLLGSRLKKINATDAKVEIRLSAGPVKNSQVTVKAFVKPKNKSAGDNKLFIALVSNKIISSIAAGENAGRKLTHHYVVHKLTGPIKSSLIYEKSYLLDPKNNSSGLAIVAFVEDDRGSILQSIRLSLE